MYARPAHKSGRIVRRGGPFPSARGPDRFLPATLPTSRGRRPNHHSTGPTKTETLFDLILLARSLSVPLAGAHAFLPCGFTVFTVFLGPWGRTGPYRITGFPNGSARSGTVLPGTWRTGEDREARGFVDVIWVSRAGFSQCFFDLGSTVRSEALRGACVDHCFVEIRMNESTQSH